MQGEGGKLRWTVTENERLEYEDGRFREGRGEMRDKDQGLRLPRSGQRKSVLDNRQLIGMHASVHEGS